MKCFIYIIGIALLLFSSCKKSRDARKMEKYLNDTKWELYLVEDANGNDITQQVLEDSLICECFEFQKLNKDYKTFNAIITRCHNTYFESYKATWGVFDWGKKERKNPNANYLGKWKNIGLAVGNKGLESYASKRYLRQISFKVSKEDDIIESRIFILEYSGLPTDTLLEKRYYKKTN